MSQSHIEIHSHSSEQQTFTSFTSYFMWAKTLVSHSEERADCEVSAEILDESRRVGVTGSWRRCSFIVVRVALFEIIIV
jgi:hypothetical protein